MWYFWIPHYYIPGELEMDDGRNVGWTFYRFQGEKDSATLRFNSYADQYYSVGVDMKCDKVETDKLVQ